jgi:hypothetical protein
MAVAAIVFSGGFLLFLATVTTHFVMVDLGLDSRKEGCIYLWIDDKR